MNAKQLGRPSHQIWQIGLIPANKSYYCTL